MIQLLFYVLVAETALILLLLLKNPFKKFGLMGLDRIKRGRGPTIVKTIAATLFMVLCSGVYSIALIQKRVFDVGSITPTDEVLLGKHLLEVSLMAFSLLLALIIDRAHHYLRELRVLRINAEAAKKDNKGYKDGKASSSDEITELGAENSRLKSKIKQLESELSKRSKDIVQQHERGSEEEVTTLKEKIKQLESDVEKKDEEAKSAEARAMALEKQSGEFLLEYGQLLEVNQTLRTQLQSIDFDTAHSDGKKNI